MTLPTQAQADSAPLFAAANINGLALSNRIAVAPMTRISASTEGHATEAMARYYARFTEGGFGLIITEGIYTDQAYSQGYANQPGLSNVAQAQAWRPVVKAIQTADGRVVAQLMHAGALSQSNHFRNGTAGPTRDDTWGGTIDHRIRMTTEVVRAVRQVVGSAAPVGVRISQGKVNDFLRKWPEAEQGAATIFAALAGSAVDYTHVTEFEAWRPAFAAFGQTLVQLARTHAPHIAVIANGSLHHPARAAAALADGADLVALGRGALSNPDWPRRLKDGQPMAVFDPALLSPFGDIKPEEE